MNLNKNIISTILFAKAVTFLIIFLAFFLLPFATKFYFSNFVYPSHSPITLETAYKTWDAQHYLYVSDHGYHIGNDSNAFPPLFPFLIRLGSFITRSSFWSGIILANILSVAGFYLFYFLVRKIYTEKIAYRSLIALLVFPTSFYFSLIYTESLFFFLVMLFFVFLQKRNLFFASIAAFLLPLTRLIGIAILLPFLASFILEYHKHSLYEQVSTIGKTLLKKETLFLLFPFGGLLLSMGIMYVATGSFFTQFTAQQNFISHYSFFDIFNPLFFLKALFTFPLAVHGFTNSFLDRSFFLGFVCFLPFLFRRVSYSFFIYAVIFGLLPVLSGSFMSYMRYLVIIFPLFIGLSKMSFEKKYYHFSFGLLFFSIMLQCLFLILHSLNYWVA